MNTSYEHQETYYIGYNHEGVAEARYGFPLEAFDSCHDYIYSFDENGDLLQKYKFIDNEYVVLD